MRQPRNITILVLLLSALAITPSVAQAQQAPPARVQWEELTAPDFARAVEEAKSTCVLPLGILEKHGPHLPLGTDLLNSRNLAVRAAQKEYAIVFPPFYFGQIFEAQHQPGTVAYSPRLMWDVLQETIDQIARNGFRKILLVNGHGGNSSFLPFFCQSQLSSRKEYAVFLFQPARDTENAQQVQKLRKTKMDQHAGEVETATMLANRPELVRQDQANSQSGEDQQRLAGLKDLYTAIWWYARFPDHYGGDGAPATRELGELVVKQSVDQLAAAIRAVKEDTKVLELQNQFFDGAERPLKTKQ